jgi:hypothetical protein
MRMGKAVQAHVYRIWGTKESLKYGMHVTQKCCCSHGLVNVLRLQLSLDTRLLHSGPPDP